MGDVDCGDVAECGQGLDVMDHKEMFPSAKQLTKGSSTIIIITKSITVKQRLAQFISYNMKLATYESWSELRLLFSCLKF